MADLMHLINRWLQGYESAAEQIYNLHKDQTFRLAFAILGDQSEAEEATQEAMTYALLNIHRYDNNRAKFSTWLYTITISKCRDIMRKHKSRATSLRSWFRKTQQQNTSMVTPETETLNNEANAIVWQALQQLSPITREAVVLRHWGGYTYQEIAEMVGCSMKTAQSRVRIAHEQLSKILNPSDIYPVLENRYEH